MSNIKQKRTEEKQSINKITAVSFFKAAPYTLVMILGLAGFWGYKAVSAASIYLEEKSYLSGDAAGKSEGNEPGDGRTEIVLGEAQFNNTSLGEPVDVSVEEPDTADALDTAEASDGLDDSDAAEASNGPDALDDSDTADALDTSDALDTQSVREGDIKDGNAASAGDSSAAGGTSSDIKEGEKDGGEDVKDNPVIPEDLKEQYPYSMGEADGNYIIYEPLEIDSLYYSDAGRIALDTPADYEYVEDDYFDNACFVGDSRMVGIFDYSGLEKADFYCDNGYCVHSYLGDKTVMCQNNGKKYTLQEAMVRKKYNKIYLMLGTNDSGYGNTESFKENYGSMVEMIKEKQPGAIVFLIANLRISAKAEKSDTTGVYNNININDKNVAISELADGESVFYFDCNAPFVDKEGYLIEEYTFDGFHVYAKQYVEMTELIKAHGIKK